MYPVSAPSHTVRASPRWDRLRVGLLPPRTRRQRSSADPSSRFIGTIANWSDAPSCRNRTPVGGGDRSRIAQVRLGLLDRASSNAGDGCQISRIEARAGVLQGARRARVRAPGAATPPPEAQFHTRSTTPHALGWGRGHHPRSIRSAFRVGCREAVDRLAGREPTGAHRRRSPWPHRRRTRATRRRDAAPPCARRCRGGRRRSAARRARRCPPSGSRTSRSAAAPRHRDEPECGQVVGAGRRRASARGPGSTRRAPSPRPTSRRGRRRRPRPRRSRPQRCAGQDLGDEPRVATDEVEEASLAGAGDVGRVLRVGPTRRGQLLDPRPRPANHRTAFATAASGCWRPAAVASTNAGPAPAARTSTSSCGSLPGVELVTAHERERSPRRHAVHPATVANRRRWSSAGARAPRPSIGSSPR